MLARRLAAVALMLAASFWSTSASAQGLILPGAGAVHRSMAGASTAAPVSAAGAAYWNPAAISGLPCNQIEFGAELLYADVFLESTIPAGAIPPGFPPTTRSGRSYSNSGLGVARTPQHSPISSANREDVARAGQIFRPCRRINQGIDGDCAISGRIAGGSTSFGVN